VQKCQRANAGEEAGVNRSHDPKDSENGANFFSPAPCHRRHHSRKTNPLSLDYAAFGAIACAAITCIVAIITKKSHFASSMAPGLFLVFASLFVFFGTTAAVKKGQFFASFYDCSREHSPVSFWITAVFCYGVFLTLSALAIYVTWRP
jgi:hypothetical protein